MQHIVLYTKGREHKRPASLNRRGTNLPFIDTVYLRRIARTAETPAPDTRTIRAPCPKWAKSNSADSPARRSWRSKFPCRSNTWSNFSPATSASICRREPATRRRNNPAPCTGDATVVAELDSTSALLLDTLVSLLLDPSTSLRVTFCGVTLEEEFAELLLETALLLVSAP